MTQSDNWGTITIGMLRKIPATGGAAAVLFFFLPWVLVSCSGAQGIRVEASGYEIASGNYNELDALSELGSLFGGSASQASQEGAEPLLWFIPVMGLVGLAALSGEKLGSQLALLAGILGMVGLAIFGISAQSSGDDIAMVGFQLEFRYGYWFSWLAFILQAGTAWVFGHETTAIQPKAVVPERSPTPLVAARTGPVTLAKLEIISGPGQRTTVDVNMDDFLIGRGSSCDLRLMDPVVSRVHARLRYADGAWFLQDQGSAKGTLVNGNSIQAVRLRPGDRIELGDTVLVFRGLAKLQVAP